MHARLRLASLAVAISAMRVGAQQPTRLPAVVVNAAPDLPGPRKMTGIVRDTSALPIDSVEIMITSLQRRAFTKGDGTFLFADIKPGTYEVRARKLGYGPEIRKLTVDGTGASAAFMLLPLPYVLRPVVTTAARGGLGGIVGDTAFNALVGANVRVLGHNDYTVTDSTGSFYMPIGSGSYLVRVSQPGFADRLVSVIVPNDSGQQIRVTLAPPSRPVPLREVHNIDDLAMRLTWRNHGNSRVYTHAELVQMKIDWIYDAVTMGYHEIHSGRTETLDKDCFAMINGGPEVDQIEKFTVDDIETVEVYDGRSGFASVDLTPRRAPAPRAFAGQAIHSGRPTINPVPISNTDRAQWANSTRTCTTVYLWLR